MADELKEPLQEPERLSSEVVALCALLARIMVRCLKERNPSIMKLLSSPSQLEEGETGGPHDAA